MDSLDKKSLTKTQISDSSSKEVKKSEKQNKQKNVSGTWICMLRRIIRL